MHVKAQIYYGRTRFASEDKNQICHYGIKGQKWGIRRFQNEDGSYTAAGKARYSKSLDEIVKKIEKNDKRWAETQEKASQLSRKAEQKFREKNPLSRITAVGYGIRAEHMFNKTSKLYTEKLNEIKKAARDLLEKSGGDLDKAVKETGKIDSGPLKRRVIDALGFAAAQNDAQKFEKLTGDEKAEYANEFLRELNADAKKKHEEWLAEDKARREGSAAPVSKKSDRELVEEARMDERAAWLQHEIEKKSIDWYNSKPVSEGARKLEARITEVRNDIKIRERTLRQQHLPEKWTIRDLHKLYDIMAKDNAYQVRKKEENRLDGELMGQVLRDIGFPDTPQNRSFIMPYVYWD